METQDFKNVEIFSTGIWEGKGSQPGGDAINESFLDEIVNSYNAVGEKVKPRLRLSHNKEQSDNVTGMAALGWLKNIKRNGNKLFADIMNVPKKIADIIDKKAFGRFSPGLWQEMNINGKVYKNVLDHLALLGADLPANTDLDGFIDLYYESEKDENIIKYEKKLSEIKEDKKIMDEQYRVLYEELKQAKSIADSEVTELEAKIQEFEQKEIDTLKTVETLENKIIEFEKKIEEHENDKKILFEKEIDMYLDTALENGKMLPSQKDKFRELAITNFEAVKDIIENNQKMEFGQQSSGHVEIPENKNDFDPHEKIVAYQKEQKCSYDEAFEAVVNGGE